jgi:opacity protein-like surface antigen
MFPIVAVGALAGALVLPSPVYAQGTSRAGTFEFILPVVYSPGATVNGQGGSSADVNSDLGFGFGFGYNVNTHLQLNGLFNWSTRGYNATLVNTDGTTRKASGTLDTSTISFNGVYYLLPKALTPFVSAGIGSTFVDSNIPTGPTSTGCWYDPWYGYICNTYTNTKTYSAVSYTAGLGLRWEASRQVALQGSYNKLWIDATSSNPTFDGWRLDLIFRM